ncbi:hypothetical protein C8J57DRAFT_1460845 [Mycena rebaudengoi]|nr:hypothetical protein C8J57DRAFT_1460845 [Mycena rebaudengoi]
MADIQVIITTILTPEALSATTTPPVTALQPAAPYTTVFTESLLHTFTTSSPPPGTPRASGAAAGNTGNLGTNGGVPKITSRSSSARASATNAVTSSPSLRSHHVSKSDIGRYTGMAIGAVFVLTLISSFFSAWWKHRKYVRTRPRGSIFVGTKLSDGQHSPQKRSMSQILMHSVSDSSFDAYAMSNTPPTTPASVSFMPSSPHSGSQQSHLDLNRGRAFSPSPVPIRPLPPTPSPKYAMHEEDTIFYAHTPPLDPRGFSPFGASPPGQILADPRSGWHMPGGDHQ